MDFPRQYEANQNHELKMANKINDKITVSPQIALTEIPEIKAQGFTVLMSNRPDGEEPGQPTVAEVQKAADEAGIPFVQIPIVSGQFTPEAVEAFREVLNENDKVFAFCRTGTRSAGLWALSQAGQMPAAEILEATQNAGYDFSMLAPYLGE